MRNDERHHLGIQIGGEGGFKWARSAAGMGEKRVPVAKVNERVD